MKINGKAKLYLLLFALLTLLSGCENQAADIEAITLEHSPDGFTRVSLRADSTQAAVSGNLDGTMHYGEPITLSAAPFFQDGVFYFPLEDVVPLTGGTCQIEGGTAQVQLYGCDLTFQVGSPDILVNGTSCRGFPEDGRAPQIVNGVFFLPQGLEAPACLEGAWGWVYEAENVVILTQNTSFGCELCAAGAWLEESFEQIPSGVRRTLHASSSKTMGVCYTAECLENKDIAIWVAHAVDPDDDPDAMEGCVVGIQLTGDTYSTWRGLRVGDSRQRAELLYGNVGPDSGLFPAYPFAVEFDRTDHVSAIEFRSHIFSRQ